MKFEFLQFRRYLDKDKKCERTLNINPILITAIEKGDKKDEVVIWVSGALHPLHVVGNVKLIKLAVEAAITSIIKSIKCESQNT